jgi:hypothetical protein
MRLSHLFRFSALLVLSSVGLFAGLDFPQATCRIKIGAQTISFPVGDSGGTMTIDGKPARTGERRNSLMRVSWIIAPIEGIGDEYVFTVRRPLQKPRTYSAVFKGGYAQLAAEEDLLIEVDLEE